MATQDVVLKPDQTVLPVITVDDYSDKEAFLDFLGAFIIALDDVDAISERIEEAYVQHQKLIEEVEERDGSYDEVPDAYDFIRDECGLTEFPQCGWLILQERYLLNRGI